MAAAVFTLTVTGKRNLGGGAFIAYGSLAADTGDYTTDGIAPTPTFPAIDPIGHREPDIVVFEDKDGYKWYYDRTNGKVLLYALNLDGAALVNGVFTQHTAAACAAGVGGEVKWVAFWFPKVP